MTHIESDPRDAPLYRDQPRLSGGSAHSFRDERCLRDGVAIECLPRGTVLDVTTRNTRYRVIVKDTDGHAVITGGSRFPDPTEVRIEGSTAGGRALKLGWIGVGLRLEMSVGPCTITTSPIRAIEAVAG